jgi:hypothetical protein
MMTGLDHGMYLFGTGFVVRNNLVRHNVGYGISFNASSRYGVNDSLIAGNLCHSQLVGAGMYIDCGPGGLHSEQISFEVKVPPNRVYHNTCWGNAGDGITLMGEDATAPHEVMNNICAENGGYSFSIVKDPQLPAPYFGVLFDYNLVDAARPRGVWYTTSTTAWGANNRPAAGRVFSEPAYGLLAGDSPARGIGSAQYGVVTDLFGRPRSDSPPDAGATPYGDSLAVPRQIWLP